MRPTPPTRKLRPTPTDTAAATKAAWINKPEKEDTATTQ
jgi:hypothetical protein